MGLRTSITALFQRRRRDRTQAAAADHAAARTVRRAAKAPTTQDVAIGGQTSSTVA